MATLYITEQQATLRKEQNRLIVERDGKALVEVHDFKVERVVIFGNVQISTQAMAFLLERGIDTAFLSMHGKLKGRLTPIESKNSPLRIAQYQRSLDWQFALHLARAIVAGKVNNCAEVLARHQRNHPEGGLQSEVEQLLASGKKAWRCTSLETLRGVEGAAAASYFRGFARMLRRNFNFQKRTRRPPADPANSMLSFAYSLLYNEAISSCAIAGFDCYIGFFHTVHYGRCSLALDLMEEFRPLIADRLTLNLTNLEVIKPEDFQPVEGRGFYLKDEARKRFLREYERLMTAEFAHKQTAERFNLRRALYGQAAVLQKAILQDASYKSFEGWR